MLKKFIFAGLLLSSLNVMANPIPEIWTVKQQLRAHLWNIGLKEVKDKKVTKKEIILPEELERALSKI